MVQTKRHNEGVGAAPGAESKSGWRPIETAPKDETELLLFTHHEADEYLDESFDAVQIGSWDKGNDSPDPMWSRAAGWDLQRIGEPTHWMPLPEAPLSKTPSTDFVGALSTTSLNPSSLNQSDQS